MQASTRHSTSLPPVLQYFIDANAGFSRAYSASHPGILRWPLSPLKETEEEVREWMRDHMVGAVEVETAATR